MRRGLVGRPEGEVAWVTGEARACEARVRVHLLRAACSTAALVISSTRQLLSTSDAPAASFKSSARSRRSFRWPRPSLIDSAVGRELLEAEV